MQTKAMARYLAEVCGRVKMTSTAGRILVPAEPLELVETMAAFLDESEHEEALWNGFAHVAGDRWRPLVEFAWEKPGSEVRRSGLYLLDLDGVLCVALPVDATGNAERLVAGLSPAASPELVGVLLLDVAASNGQEYGFELFDEVPPRIIDPVGLPRTVWAEAFTRWLDLGGDEGWIELGEQILHRVRFTGLTDEHKAFILDAYLDLALETPRR